jgi:hypothetical protein
MTDAAPLLNRCTDRGALADDIEGALINSEGKDFLMDAGFAREVIGALRAEQAEQVKSGEQFTRYDYELAYRRGLKVGEQAGTERAAKICEVASYHSCAELIRAAASEQGEGK